MPTQIIFRKIILETLSLPHTFSSPLDGDHFDHLIACEECVAAFWICHVSRSIEQAEVDSMTRTAG